MQKARRQAEALRLLVSMRFQVLFHSPHRGTFHHSLTVLFAIGHQFVFSLAKWSSLIHTEFHGFRATRVHHEEASRVSSTGLSPSAVRRSSRFDYTEAL